MFRDKNVFISGGNGVIGKELVSMLSKMGANLFVGDLKPRPDFWPKEIRYRQGDLNYISRKEIDSFKPHYFFHLAATFERSTENYDFWHENHHHNVLLGTHLMTIFKDCPTLEKVINCSSYLIYEPELYYFDGPAKAAKSLNELDTIYPRNLTGAAKLNHEIELRFLDEFRNKQFKSVSARIFRSYGKNSRDIISRWIRALLVGEQLTVYHKEGLFDYIYAGDVARGLIKLATKDCEGIYNLGSGKARSVADILSILKIHFPEMTFVEIKKDLPYEGSEANIQKLISATGWKPTIELEDAIPLMIKHEKKYGYSDEFEIEESNVLITSISDKIPLYHSVQQAISKLGTNNKVHVADINPECIGALVSDYFWKMPKIENLENEQIINYCTSNNIKLIIPTRDHELLFWSKRKVALAEHNISVMVSDPEVIHLCYDKLEFYMNSTTDGFPLIETSLDISAIDCEFYVVKERYGAGAKSVGLRLSKEEALNHAKVLKDPIFQPYIEGTEISVDIFSNQSGQCKGIVSRTRDLVIGGESQVTSTYFDEDLEILSKAFVNHLKIKGHAVLQLFRLQDGGYKIIECNPRFGGASTLSIACGLDSFYWAILEAIGTDLNEYPIYRTNNKLKQIRYKKDLIQQW